MPCLRALRFQKLNFIFKKKNFFLKFFKKNEHQHNRYHKTKIKKYQVCPSFIFIKNLFKGKFFCYDILTCNLKYKSIFKNISGVTYITPLINSIGFGESIKIYKNAANLLYFLKNGSIVLLKFLKVNFLTSNIGFYKPQLSVSNGTFCTINNFKHSYVNITLPSGLKKFVPSNSYAFLGRNSGIYTYKQYFGKSYLSRFSRNRVIVRSCAKNPVDHPNGGRTRGKQKIKTPWGKIARSGK